MLSHFFHTWLHRLMCIYFQAGHSSLETLQDPTSAKQAGKKLDQSPYAQDYGKEQTGQRKTVPIAGA